MIDQIIEIRDRQAECILADAGKGKRITSPEEREAASQWQSLRDEVKRWSARQDAERVFGLLSIA